MIGAGTYIHTYIHTYIYTYIHTCIVGVRGGELAEGVGWGRARVGEAGSTDEEKARSCASARDSVGGSVGRSVGRSSAVLIFIGAPAHT